jgi:hypothetical protein
MCVVACQQINVAKALISDSAHYVVDPSRTRRPAVGGTMICTLGKLEKGAQHVVLAFDLMHQNGDVTKGDQEVVIPAEFLTGAFLDDLRIRGKLSQPPYTAEHMGQHDVTTLDGMLFRNADLVQITGIPNDPRGHRIEELVVDLALFPGLPCIGAAKIDLRGQREGSEVRVGADFE